MHCPTCHKEFFPQPAKLMTLWADAREDSDEVESYAIQQCPSCHEVIVIRSEGSGWKDGQGEIHVIETRSEEVIYPPAEEFVVADEVPDEYRNDLVEARSALSFSAKASAALSRRLLQKTLREVLGIKKRDLSLEIDDFVESTNAPSYLTGAVDAIRQVGNFAAHPLKNTNTGEIVDVEPGEAEWLVEVLESLFDFVFVQPVRLQQRRESLNEKLREMGKPELKGA